MSANCLVSFVYFLTIDGEVGILLFHTIGLYNIGRLNAILFST